MFKTPAGSAKIASLNNTAPWCGWVGMGMGPFSIISHLAMNIGSPEDRDEKWGKHIWHLGFPDSIARHLWRIVQRIPQC